jgi:hypothetical protein
MTLLNFNDRHHAQLAARLQQPAGRAARLTPARSSNTPGDHYGRKLAAVLPRRRLATPKEEFEMGAIISLIMMLVSAMIIITIMMFRLMITLTMLTFRLTGKMIDAFTRR